jgi:hypothetical protein
MKTQKYSVNQHLIQILLSWVRSGDIRHPGDTAAFRLGSSKKLDRFQQSSVWRFPIQ